MQTKNSSVTNMILFGILLILAVFTVYNVAQDNAQQTRDAIDRCMETAGTGVWGRTYCNELHK